MSKYTTGEMAKLCGVSVRTVQYYDTRNILVPSELSEGGRRLYSEEDLRKLKVICFLRSMDIPINSIAQLFSEEDPGNVISLILEQQEAVLRQEIGQREMQLERLEQMSKELKGVEHFSVESIGDIAYMMESRKQLRRLRGLIFAGGIPLDLTEIAAVAVWIIKGIWWPFALWLIMDLGIGIWLIRYYLGQVAYICPQCHEVFRSSTKEVFFAKHTPATRKLTCPHCGRKGFCVETCANNEKPG